MCKYGLLYLVAFAIPVLRVQLRFVNCINKWKKKEEIGDYKVLSDIDSYRWPIE